MKLDPGKEIFKDIYSGLEMPLSDQDCGLKCGPYNDYGVPVCCDIQLVVPAAYELEWVYLRENTDLWKPWSCSGLIDEELRQEAQDGQVLLQCKGYQACQRPFRTLTCRAFPFYPYLSGGGEFLGVSYYADFREECWIISNLGVVSQEYKEAFQRTFIRIFELFPESKRNYLDYCQYAREEAASRKEPIVLLDFTGGVSLVEPISERIKPADFEILEAYGPFAVVKELRFPDELEDEKD